MKSFVLLAFVVLALGSASLTYAADGTPVWTNIFNGFASGDDAPRAVTVDTNGISYVTGYVVNSVANGDDYETVKYSPTGAVLWSRALNGVASSSGDDKTCAVVVDKNSNVYITGKSQTTNGYDMLTIMYTSSGMLWWRGDYNSTGNADDIATALAVDADGEACIAGVSTLAGVSNWTTVKYSSAGTMSWARSYSGTGNGPAQPNAIATDASGGIYVAGYSTGNANNLDYTTIKYSSGGTVLWINLFNGATNGNDAAQSLAVDADGDVYVTGYATGNGGSYDFATIKYSSSGSGLWTNFFNGAGDTDDKPVALAVDTNKNVYVTGTSFGSGGSSGCVTIKYSNTGAPVWTNFFNGMHNSGGQASGLALDASGNVYMAGTDIGGANPNQYVTIKYSTTGTPVWTNFFSGGTASAIAADAAGNVFVTGSFNGDYATIKYSAPPPPFYFVTTNDNFGSFSNKFVLSLIGPAGSNAIISASTNFQDWVPIATNLLSSGTLQITDTVSASYVRRLYRAQLQ